MPQGTHRRLPDVDFAGKVRARDPETSWDAAAQQTRKRTDKLKAEIFVILDVVGPLTDDEIFAFREDVRVDLPSWRRVTAQSLRSRRASLVADGRVRPQLGPVPDLDSDGHRPPTPVVKRPSNNNGPSTVWEVVPR